MTRLVFYKITVQMNKRRKEQKKTMCEIEKSILSLLLAWFPSRGAGNSCISAVSWSGHMPWASNTDFTGTSKLAQASRLISCFFSLFTRAL